MNQLARDILGVQGMSLKMNGVFSISDLANLLNETDGVLLHRRINRLIDAGLLNRFIRGFYTAQSPNLGILCMRIHEGSCISLASALAKHLMIGTVPAHTVFAVKTGRTRTYEAPAGRLVYAGIQPDLVFGGEYDQGICVASREKALLDTLYYYQKGRQYFFNIFSDINLTGIDVDKLLKWLRRYRNLRFTSFVEGYLDGRT